MSLMLRITWALWEGRCELAAPYGQSLLGTPKSRDRIMRHLTKQQMTWAADEAVSPQSSHEGYRYTADLRFPAFSQGDSAPSSSYSRMHSSVASAHFSHRRTSTQIFECRARRISIITLSDHIRYCRPKRMCIVVYTEERNYLECQDAPGGCIARQGVRAPTGAPTERFLQLQTYIEMIAASSGVSYFI